MSAGPKTQAVSGIGNRLGAGSMGNAWKPPSPSFRGRNNDGDDHAGCEQDNYGADE